MVVAKKKFCCGQGSVLWYYCEICGTPHEVLEEAEICEKSHRA